MSISEVLTQILKEIVPTKNLEKVNNIIDGGYLDSLELMTLITRLSDTFGFEMDIDWITPENFNSVTAMENLVKCAMHKDEEGPVR